MSKEQWIKIGKGAAIAVAGALLTYIEFQVIPDLKEQYGVWAPVLTAINSTVIQTLRKFIEAVKSEGE